MLGMLRRRPSGVRPSRTGVLAGMCLSISSGLRGPAKVTLRLLLVVFTTAERRSTLREGVDALLAEGVDAVDVDRAGDAASFGVPALAGETAFPGTP